MQILTGSDDNYAVLLDGTEVIHIVGEIVRAVPNDDPTNPSILTRLAKNLASS